jgi:hypothetical protein
VVEPTAPASNRRRTVTDRRVEDGEGGESACYAHLTCPECGTVVDGTGPRDNCTWRGIQRRIELTRDMDPELRD